MSNRRTIRFRRGLTAVALSSALLAAPACTGGQTGDGTGTQDDREGGDPTGNSGEGGRCNYQTQPVTDLDDASELGFSDQSHLCGEARRLLGVSPSGERFEPPVCRLDAVRARTAEMHESIVVELRRGTV